MIACCKGSTCFVLFFMFAKILQLFLRTNKIGLYVYTKIMKNKNNFSLSALLFLIALFASCNYTIKVKDGSTAYNLKRYDNAIPMLQKEYGKAKSRNEKGKLAYQIAESYQQIGKPQQAVQWFKTAYDNSYGAEALKGYAYALKQTEKYKEALEEFKNLGIEIGSPYEYRKEITSCAVAQDWNKQAANNGYSIDLAPFNSPQNDFSPIWAPDKRLVFTSDRSSSTGKNNYGWTGNRFMDIFVVEATEASPQNYDIVLNSPYNEGTPCFNKKGDEIFFVRTSGAYKGDDQFCKIFVAQSNENKTWSSPTPLLFQKDRINYVHPCLSPDGNTLYFAANDPEGWGGYDIYAVTRKPNNETGWSEPKLLSRSVNTTGNDLFPTFDADTLYFASNGHPGMGGLDIFKTHKLDKTNWAPPINLKSPINSGGDDFGLIVAASTTNKSTLLKEGDVIRSGFFTSNRPNEKAKGMDDIYQFTQRVPPPAPPVPLDTIPKKDIVNQIIIEGYVVEKIYATAEDPNSKVLGRRPLDKVTVNIEGQEKPIVLKTGADGYFKIIAAAQTDYKFTANKEEYLSNYTKFSTKGVGKDPNKPIQTFEVEIVLDKIYRNKEIVLENIYYDYDKWDIRPDAEPTLNKLADMLTQNPTIRIQLGSHTDCRGNDSYNQNLSQKRAESAVQYLTGRGISTERLGAIGYGEGSPAADCNCNKCTEQEHQQNRRTTFKIE